MNDHVSPPASVTDDQNAGPLNLSVPHSSTGREKGNLEHDLGSLFGSNFY